jgi:hypothetical protein
LTSLTLKYHGKISGWANIVEDRRIALSFYSAWFPQEPSIPLNLAFTMADMEDYFVLNAKYCTEDKTWHYGEGGYDVGNIIALKKGEYYAAKTGNFTFYYINEKEQIVGSYLVHYYGDIIAFYNELFGPKEHEKFDYVSLGIKDGSGAYFRKELVVADRMDYNLHDENAVRLDAASLLAHELGHNWFMGAKTDCWEDWLNETGATWASILYALKKGDNDLLGQLLEWPQKHYLEAPVIQSPDGSRPNEGVHERGTMMLYELYKAYGTEIIIIILKTFVEIPEKTTASLLAALRAKIGDDIPDLIEKGLTLTEYSTLCAE